MSLLRVTANRSTRRATGRRRQRGAALVEALIVLPFFILSFACAVFIGKLYRDTIRGIGEAKNRAWATALNGCRGNGGDNIVGESGGADLDVADRAPGAELTQIGFGGVTETVKNDVVAAPIMGGFAVQLKSTVIVACNEVPQDGNAIGMAKYIW